MFSAVSVAVCFVLMIVVNALANALPLNGLSTGAVSALYPNAFVPAGYVFSIWSLIYLLLAVFTVTRFFRSERARPETPRVNLLFGLSCLANAAWIFAGSVEPARLRASARTMNACRPRTDTSSSSSPPVFLT